jgi:hypothetical protein
MLPDDVLLEIFDFYVGEEDEGDEDEDVLFKGGIEEWQTLVHVCWRWRSLVFGSPRRLNLRLVCTLETPARDTLDAWPSLPLLVQCSGSLIAHPTEDVDNIIAVLEHSNRVVKIDLIKVDGSELENVLVAMQVPFPELTDLQLTSEDGMVSVRPDSFLDGSAPRLQSLSLAGIPFPGLPKLLLSATHLVHLYLDNIPHSGYFSPEAMVAVLSTLTSLDSLSLQFESPQSHPDRASRRPPPLTRSVLPALTSFQFKGVCEYLEDFVACIDAPPLNNVQITFFNQIVFDTPQFIQFIRRTSLKAFKNALVQFTDRTSRVHLATLTPCFGTLDMEIPCVELDWQVSSMEQVCTMCLPPLSTLEDLLIYEDPRSQPVWQESEPQDNIENALWLELLQPFTHVKNLYLSEKFASRIIPALQELAEERSTEVLPSLQNIILEKPEFAAMRVTQQITSHPIAVSRWRTSLSDMITDKLF